MYQKQLLPEPQSIGRTNRFKVFAVLIATLVVGTTGTYFTVIGPRLRANSSEQSELLDQIGVDGSELAFANVSQTGESEDDDEDASQSEDAESAEGQEGAPLSGDSQATAQQGTTDKTPQLASSNSGYKASWATNVLAGKSFFLGSHNPAATTADEWRATRPDDAAYMDVVAAPAKGIWLVMGISNISSYVSSNTNAAAAQGKIPIFVLYGMPTTGCSGPSSSAAKNYLSWVDKIDTAITNKAVIIIEPDELPLTQCGGSAETGREEVLKSAVTKLAGSNRYLYIDAGHGSWVAASTMAERLQRVGVEMTQGFSLNVSNYTTTSVNTSYGNSLSSILGGAHFVIDTSRNGLGPDPTNEWCNAPGRALGELPKTYSSGSKLNALVWAKYPGESDGSCNGGPSEGQWWPEYALGLAVRAE